MMYLIFFIVGPTASYSEPGYFYGGTAAGA